MQAYGHTGIGATPLPAIDLGCRDSPGLDASTYLLRIGAWFVATRGVSVLVCFPNSNCTRGDQEFVPETMTPGFGVSPRLGIMLLYQYTHACTIMPRPPTAARTTSVGIRTVCHERVMGLSDDSDARKSHNRGTCCCPHHGEPGNTVCLARKARRTMRKTTRTTTA